MTISETLSYLWVGPNNFMWTCCVQAVSWSFRSFQGTCRVRLINLGTTSSLTCNLAAAMRDWISCFTAVLLACHDNSWRTHHTNVSVPQLGKIFFSMLQYFIFFGLFCFFKNYVDQFVISCFATTGWPCGTVKNETIKEMSKLEFAWMANWDCFPKWIKLP